MESLLGNSCAGLVRDVVRPCAGLTQSNWRSLANCAEPCATKITRPSWTACATKTVAKDKHSKKILCGSCGCRHFSGKVFCESCGVFCLIVFVCLSIVFLHGCELLLVLSLSLSMFLSSSLWLLFYFVLGVKGMDCWHANLGDCVEDQNQHQHKKFLFMAVV